MTPEDEFAGMRAENARQREQIAALLAQNTALQERAGAGVEGTAGQRQPLQLEAALQ
jgi:hypothetical protein